MKKKVIDRSVAPPIRTIEELKLIKPRSFELDNGIPVHVIDLGTQDILKLDLVFKAGRPYERKQLVSRAAGVLLKEGSERFSGAEVAELVDFFGGTLSTPVGMDLSSIMLFSLSRHFASMLPVIRSVLSEPIFPERELSLFKDRNKRRLSVELTRNDVVAYRKITELIFGKDHPYGYNSEEYTYDALQREDLLEHYRRCFVRGNCSIFLSGKIKEEHLHALNAHLGDILPDAVAPQPLLPDSVQTPQQLQLPHPDRIQTAIRIGRRLFKRDHPDYLGMYVLNTILGGYFGSRLMANIREEKGFTYNIYSSLDTMLYDGYFCIGTEVGNEFVGKALKEIYREMDRLCEELVQEEELSMVRNYLLGNLLTMLDGPFQVADVIRTMKVGNLPEDSFERLVDTIRHIRPAELRELAQRYLRKDDMWEVVVG